jgi:uncharacterized membrane protein YraQ (UPF0718 family)
MQCIALYSSFNILAVLLTGDLLSWELAAVSIISSVAVAIAAGLIVSKTPWGKAIEKRTPDTCISPNDGSEFSKDTFR